MSWSDLGKWWLSEIADDPTYEDVVSPLLMEVLQPTEGSTYLDLGSGDGRVMRRVSSLAAKAIGLDISEELLSRSDGRVAVADLEDMPLKAACVDGAYAVLVLEHLRDIGEFFEEAGRVVKPAGILAVVSNHPVWTAPGSTPIEDEEGEVLWRPGEYFSDGSTDVEVADESITFHHRPMGTLLNAAAVAGWSLEKMVERPHHELDEQADIPRLLACRWRLLP